jgi:hypothetical protein
MKASWEADGEKKYLRAGDSPLVPKMTLEEALGPKPPDRTGEMWIAFPVDKIGDEWKVFYEDETGEDPSFIFIVTGIAHVVLNRIGNVYWDYTGVSVNSNGIADVGSISCGVDWVDGEICNLSSNVYRAPASPMMMRRLN